MNRLVTAPVLVYPCFTKLFVLHTDASALRLEVVLKQEQQDRKLHPVAYASQTMVQSNYNFTHALYLMCIARMFQRGQRNNHTCTYKFTHLQIKYA